MTAPDFCRVPRSSGSDRVGGVGGVYEFDGKDGQMGGVEGCGQVNWLVSGGRGGERKGSSQDEEWRKGVYLFLEEKWLGVRMLPKR